MTTTIARASDLETLQALNRDYIRSVQQSDVGRFDEILADDFRCSNPDGSVLDRAGFLKQTAVPVRISNLEVHDVEVRLMGDFAIIHARTTYTLPDGRAVCLRNAARSMSEPSGLEQKKSSARISSKRRTSECCTDRI
jgi:ketosteroid isomerase-like protein